MSADTDRGAVARAQAYLAEQLVGGPCETENEIVLRDLLAYVADLTATVETLTSALHAERTQRAALEQQLTRLRERLQQLQTDCRDDRHDFHRFGSAGAGVALWWCANQIAVIRLALLPADAQKVEPQ
jgi:hypothetical protein